MFFDVSQRFCNNLFFFGNVGRFCGFQTFAGMRFRTIQCRINIKAIARKFISCCGQNLLDSIFAALEISCFFSLQAIVFRDVHGTVRIGFLRYLSICIINIRSNVTFRIGFCLFVAVRIVSCQCSMTLIRRVIRSIFRSFTTQQVIFCNCCCRCAACSIISGNRNVIEFVILIFFDRIKIL